MEYTDSLEGIGAADLQGFFAGWPNPPIPETHLKLLHNSSHVVLALEEGQAVGFITAISDGVLSAYIPLLEVLPTHQGRGVGAELVRRMLEQLRQLYMVDLLCDAELLPFYEKFGLRSGTGAFLRRYKHQSGSEAIGAVQPRAPGSGNWKGKIEIADDFDALPDELTRGFNGETE
jgi:GNAT superfamily N-acetyltransferase